MAASPFKRGAETWHCSQLPQRLLAQWLLTCEPAVGRVRVRSVTGRVVRGGRRKAAARAEAGKEWRKKAAVQAEAGKECRARIAGMV